MNSDHSNEIPRGMHDFCESVGISFAAAEIFLHIAEKCVAAF